MDKKDKNNNENKMDQLRLDIPQIDEEATRMNAEKLLEQYCMYLLQVPEDFLPKVTATYSLVPPSFSNEFHSSTEDAALKRMDWEIERDRFLKRMQRAVNRLSQKERQILVMLYMQNEEMYDYEVYAEMRLSQRSYYRTKAKAFYRLAFALRVEVYKDGGTP